MITLTVRIQIGDIVVSKSIFYAKRKHKMC